VETVDPPGPPPMTMTRGFWGMVIFGLKELALPAFYSIGQIDVKTIVV